MKIGFKAFFWSEVSQVLKKRYIIIFACIAFILLVAVEHGRGKYQSVLKEHKEFQQIENERVKQYIFLTQYTGYGLRLLFTPSPFSVISPFPPRWISHLNVGDQLEIYKNEKEDSAFFDSAFNYSTLITTLGCLFCLLYGASGTHNREYIKSYSSLIEQRKLFIFIFLSRSVIIFSVFFLLYLIVLLYMIAFGINLFSFESCMFFVFNALTFVFFLLIGVAIGTIKDKGRYLAVAGLIFAVFIFAIPLALNVILEKLYIPKTPYKLEAQNLSVLMSLEEKLYKKFGKYDENKGISSELKRRMEQAVLDEFGTIEKNELKNLADFSRDMRLNHLLSLLFPVTIKNNINRELGSGGHKAFINFYKYSIYIKREFTKYYIKKKSEKRKPIKGTLENFIKGNENIFYASSVLPPTYLIKLLALLIWICIASFIAYIRYKKLFIFRIPKEVDETKDLNTKALNCILTCNPAIEHFVFIELTKRNTNFFTIDSNPIEIDFVYFSAVTPFSNRVFLRFLDLDIAISDQHPLELAIHYASKNNKGLIIGGALDQMDEIEINKIKNLIYQYNVLALHIGRDRYTFKAFADKHIRYKNDKSIDMNGYEIFRKRKSIENFLKK